MQAKGAAVDVRLWKKMHAQACVWQEYHTPAEVLLLSRRLLTSASFPQSPLASNDLNETGQTCGAQAKDTAVDVRLWKKKHAQARVRREYRTADEVLAEAAEKPQAAPKQTIIDMRGPQVLHFCHATLL